MASMKLIDWSVPKDEEQKIVVECVLKIVGIGLRWAAEQKATRALFVCLID